MTQAIPEQSFELGLAGRTAVVTGAGAGIGQAIAVALARVGVSVGLVEIDPERAASTLEIISKAGGTALVLPTDVMDTEALAGSITTAHGEFGRLDILVNNAGGVKANRFLKQSERSWRRHIDINLVSMIAATSTAAPLIAAGGVGGSILNITSIEGQRAAPLYAVYAACKAGMISFTRTMALELGEDQIRVNALAPDHTATAGMRGIFAGPVDPDNLPPLSAERQADVERYVPLGREGHADEVGDAAVFLSSDRAKYITGVTLNIDGGAWASSGWGRAGDGWTLYPGDTSVTL
ncbi:SDR family NAD(P)-dependent oxidoreductase [Frankia tisae]|uniref:SDR family NAD(P)-dependent oxidoreductase n=1 Tax=Frankia tisae TaxID=2950104 RepID=UPI0021BE36FF|nr:SDR family oxidoreductase [Frankia tisae]